MSIFVFDIRVNLWGWALLVTLVTSPAIAQTKAQRRALSSNKPRVRITAIVAVAKAKPKGARALIEPLLQDKDPAVRAAAAEGLERLGDVAALAALRAHTDPAPLVAGAVERAIIVLEAKEKQAAGRDPNALTVSVPPPVDASGKVPPALLQRFGDGVRDGITAQKRLPVEVYDEVRKSGYGVRLSIRAVNEATQGPVHVLTVTCEMTLVQLPQNALRMQASATAGGGFEEALDDKMREELMRDGINECIPALTSDFVEYALARAARVLGTEKPAGKK